jgi:hypothetical protein
MNYLRGQGAYAVKLHGGAFQQAGLPDIMAILNGCVMFLEVKTERGKVSRIQEHCHGKMRAAGANVAVVRSVVEVEKFIYGVDTFTSATLVSTDAGRDVTLSSPINPDFSIEPIV